jgi:hypothetical protein
MLLACGLCLWVTYKRNVLLATALCLITTNYLLCLMFRAHIAYQAIMNWGRYEIFAHLGLATLVVLLLSHWKPQPRTEILYPVLLSLGLFLFHQEDRRLLYHNNLRGNQPEQLARLEKILKRAHDRGVRQSEVSAHLAHYRVDVATNGGFHAGQLYSEPARASASWDPSLEQ